MLLHCRRHVQVKILKDLIVFNSCVKMMISATSVVEQHCLLMPHIKYQKFIIMLFILWLLLTFWGNQPQLQMFISLQLHRNIVQPLTQPAQPSLLNKEIALSCNTRINWVVFGQPVILMRIQVKCNVIWIVVIVTMMLQYISSQRFIVIIFQLTIVQILEGVFYFTI